MRSLVARKRIFLLLSAILCILLLGSWLTSSAQAGGTGLDIALTEDDGVLISGTTNHPTFAEDFFLARLLETSALDPDFGTGGQVRMNLNGRSEGAQAIDRCDEQVIAAGTTNATLTTGNDFGALRFQSNGRLDRTFSNGPDQVAISHWTASDEAQDTAQQCADKKVIVVGSVSNDVALVRFNVDGSLDTSFDGDGKVRLNMSSPIGTDIAHSVVVLPDGKILVAGEGQATNKDFLIARFNANGSLDTSFGSSGKRMVDFGGSDIARELIIDSAGRIVVAGSTDTTSTDAEFAVARLSASGTLDTSFDSDGKAIADFVGGDDLGHGLMEDDNGNYVVVGQADDVNNLERMGVARFTPSGVLDSSFGFSGKQQLYPVVTIAGPLGQPSIAYDVVIDSSDRLLVVGHVEHSVLHPVVARLTAAGLPDGSWGGVGYSSSIQPGFVVLEDPLVAENTTLNPAPLP